MKTKYPKETVEAVRNLYINKKISLKEIAKNFGITTSTIYRWTRDLHRRRRQAKRDKATINLIVNMYRNNTTISDISDKLDIHPSSIRDILHKNGFKLPHRGPKSLIGNELYFDNINSENKAYFLGWLMADGNVTIANGQYCLKIHISAIDKDVAYKFMDAIESKNKIRIETKYVNGNIKQYIAISLSSKHLCSSLIKYGVKPNKTGCECLPKIDDKLIHHFIRGYFDGDGITSIGKSQKRSGFISSKTLLIEIQKHLNTTQKMYHPSNTKNENVFYFLYGKKESKKLYKYMYHDASIYMKRKRERMDIICDNTEITNGIKKPFAS